MTNDQATLLARSHSGHRTTYPQKIRLAIYRIVKSKSKTINWLCGARSASIQTEEICLYINMAGGRYFCDRFTNQRGMSNNMVLGALVGPARFVQASKNVAGSGEFLTNPMVVL